MRLPLQPRRAWRPAPTGAAPECRGRPAPRAPEPPYRSRRIPGRGNTHTRPAAPAPPILNLSGGVAAPLVSPRCRCRPAAVSPSRRVAESPSRLSWADQLRSWVRFAPHSPHRGMVMFLLRHGQSFFNLHFNATRVDPGIEDPELTPLGIEQAQAAAMELAEVALTRIIVSPYARALQTADPILPVHHLPVHVMQEVRERAAFV